MTALVSTSPRFEDTARLLRPVLSVLKRMQDRLRATAPPARRRRASEAARLRARALLIQRTDPSYASDLFAAADLHEGLDGTSSQA